jgi:cyclopropane fatty-acyl-phospholipid synthase-like methyltransferase
MDNQQNMQAIEYRFPYHYIPSEKNGRVTNYVSWNFTESYLMSVKLISGWMNEIKISDQTHRHVDIGCGDGALIYNLRKQIDDVMFTGIDYDERAIDWALMFNDQASTFSCIDVTHESELNSLGSFNSASLIEVIEHIPPELLQDFISSVSKLIDEDGHLVVTVPHKNVPVLKKHYQHFDFDSIVEVLSPRFRLTKISGLGKPSAIWRLYRRLTRNRLWFIDIPFISAMSYKAVQKNVGPSENNAIRIYAEFTKVN